MPVRFFTHEGAGAEMALTNDNESIRGSNATYGINRSPEWGAPALPGRLKKFPIIAIPILHALHVTG